MTLYLSRLDLSQRPDVAALNALLDPAPKGAQQDAHHRLIWSAFAGDPEAGRDFLWRAEGRGRFIVLSARPPQASALFDPPQVKPFAPDLRTGDRLRFVLRTNATRTRKGVGRVDVVMDALHSVPQAERATQRMAIAQGAAQDWLAGQGARHGFQIAWDDDHDRPALAVDDYSVVALPAHRGKRQGQPQFGILDLTGQIIVTDPAAFIDRLAAGFGRAKAFGCGLMLIRRA
ncbi:MAG: type I-E CRISPR-associated protein Cas6/Cse3/CasE [Paracoccus sp. (in: a-proteobacteria)]|uniref:type I-E CRISPR-associated protein Cas6/Cse3/CasE n=1 Tax=Paracoccus sp. TaxID=267 RepID=UPI0026DF9840|nr:type I-E CRISPR-associated protein Cas6/Cse3/CasE [Paracoccus sp. (in: a-proteobacteria)]MDO5632323.1 type I-E CRISPR-associated protein Cas6/Cse3/CasE [Paracoccus sp. (in: a-proteobacteria)]